MGSAYLMSKFKCLKSCWKISGRSHLLSRTAVQEVLKLFLLCLIGPWSTRILGEWLKMLELKARSTKKKDPLPAASTLGARQGFLSLASGFSCEGVFWKSRELRVRPLFCPAQLSIRLSTLGSCQAPCKKRGSRSPHHPCQNAAWLKWSGLRKMSKIGNFLPFFCFALDLSSDPVSSTNP